MKKLLLIIFLCLSLNANINQAVLGIIGSSDFNTHRNLINTLFKNQSYFYTNGSLDYAKISQTLQNNNLLKLSLGSTQTIEATFIFNSDFIFKALYSSFILECLHNEALCICFIDPIRHTCRYIVLCDSGFSPCNVNTST